MNKFGIWPTPKINPFELLNPTVTHAEIESWFKEKYPAAFPVLFSSARAGIRTIMEYKQLVRNNHVFIPPFASHCLFNAISLNSTPTPILSDKNIKAAFVFHQWGIPFYLKRSDILIIEDSIDSVITSDSGLFINDGDFELLSLPKIIGSVTGGIVLCKKKKDAEALKKSRDDRKYFSNLHFFLRSNIINRVYLQHYSSTLEVLGGKLPGYALSEIKNKLGPWKEIIKLKNEKMKKYLHLSQSLNYNYSPYRLLSCIPIESKENNIALTSLLPQRHILSNQVIQESLDLTKVHLIPLHSQVKFNLLPESPGPNLT